MSDARARGDLAESMLPVAAHMSALVHGDGGPEDVREVLASLDGAQRDALIVVLAGLVDPDQEIGKALGWLDFNEIGEVDLADWSRREPIRSLAEGIEPELDEHYVDPTAVEGYLHGKDVTVTKSEQLAAIRAGAAMGMTYLEFDRLHGLKPNSTATFVSRARKMYVEWGITFPEVTMPAVPSVFTEEQVIEIRERSARGVPDVEIAMSFGVARKTITAVASGDSYVRYGGPIRAKRVRNTPGEATREQWVRSPVLATAS